MEKEKSEIRWVHVANHIHQNLFQQPYLIGGFYNWCKVFKSQIYYYAQIQGHFKEYDVVFVDIAKPEMEAAMVSRIREEIGWNSSTLIVGSVDYAIELWKGLWNLHHLRRELLNVDYIFCAEPYMGKCLNQLLNGLKDVYLLAHPTNVDVYKKIALPPDKRENLLLAMVHRYDNNWVSPWLATKNITNINKVAVLLDGGQEMFVLPYFPVVRTGREFSEWVNTLKLARVGIDSYSNVHSYGRVPVDFGCFGVPVVASKICYTQNVVWPDLVTEPWDVEHQAKLLERLLKDEEFYLQCIEKANIKVEEFGYKNSKQKFIDMINGKGEKI